MSGGKQIGNAVPIDLGKFLIQHLKFHLIDKSMTQRSTDYLEASEEDEFEAV